MLYHVLVYIIILNGAILFHIISFYMLFLALYHILIINGGLMAVPRLVMHVDRPVGLNSCILIHCSRNIVLCHIILF